MAMPINHTPEFQKVLRGYKVEEVDEFVGEISAGYEQLRREVFSVKEDNEKLKKQLEYFQALESSLNRALVAAQQKADEIINSAQDEVNRSLVDSKDRLENINTEIAQILAGATEKASQIEEEANRRSEEIIARVRNQVSGELSQHSEMGHKIDKIRTELAQSLRGFLQGLEGTPTMSSPTMSSPTESTASSSTDSNIPW
jgi:cell division initiation protein